jgi:acylphosphatase
MRQRFRVDGRVQGVGFRYWVRMRAIELGLGGSVRNLADGSVEVEVEGAADAVARLKTLLADGPRHAEVSSIASLPAREGPLPGIFEVMY